MSGQQKLKGVYKIPPPPARRGGRNQNTKEEGKREGKGEGEGEKRKERGMVTGIGGEWVGKGR